MNLALHPKLKFYLEKSTYILNGKLAFAVTFIVFVFVVGTLILVQHAWSDEVDHSVYEIGERAGRFPPLLEQNLKMKDENSSEVAQADFEGRKENIEREAKELFLDVGMQNLTLVRLDQQEFDNKESDTDHKLIPN